MWPDQEAGEALPPWGGAAKAGPFSCQSSFVGGGRVEAGGGVGVTSTHTVPWHGTAFHWSSLQSALGQPACHLQEVASGMSSAVWSLRAGCQSSTPIPGPHLSAAPSTLWTFEGVGNGTFFWLKGKLSLGPLVLRQAVGKGSDEGRQ